ncbi:MAG: hypothetical protein V3U76_00660 [Granulosicoccus sp.]
MQPNDSIIFASQSATATGSTQKLHHDLLDQRLPAALRAINRNDLANGIWFDRSQQQNRMNDAIKQAASSAPLGLLLWTMPWQASNYVREVELPLFNPVKFHQHGRHVLGVMFEPSALPPGEINKFLSLDTDGGGGVQWLNYKDRYAYSQLSDADRNRFATRIAIEIAGLLPIAKVA